MADNKETLAQAMFGKSEEDLDKPEARELKELAGRGHLGSADPSQQVSPPGPERASNVNAPGREPAAGLGAAAAAAESDEGGPTSETLSQRPPGPEEARRAYGEGERPREARRASAPPS